MSCATSRLNWTRADVRRRSSAPLCMAREVRQTDCRMIASWAPSPYREEPDMKTSRLVLAVLSTILCIGRLLSVDARGTAQAAPPADGSGGARPEFEKQKKEAQQQA